MSPMAGEEDQGGGSGMKRKHQSPGPVDEGNVRKKTAPDKDARVKALLAEVYDGVVTNEFVPQDIKDATKEMRELVLDIIQRGKAEAREKTESVIITKAPIGELMKKSLVICWAKEKDQNYEEVIKHLPAIREIPEELLMRPEGVLVQREEIVLINGANPNAQPPKKCLLLSAGEWEGGQEKILESLETVVNRIGVEQANEVTVILPLEWKVATMQKLMQERLQSTSGSLVKCYMRGDPAQTKIKDPKPSAMPKETNINVPLGTKTYAEVLSELKEKVSPESVGVEIWKTVERKGNVKVTIKGNDKSKARDLVEDINKRTEAGATLEVKEKGLFVYNIEDDVNEDEISRVLAHALGVSEIKMSVSFRSNDYGKAALVITEEDVAEKLCRLRFVRRSGWTNWNIKEKTNPRFCVRCQFYGHSPRDCQKDPAKSARCMKCGQGGHLQKDCQNDVFCACCEKKGHRMNSMTCPVFRRCVEMERSRMVFR